MTGQEKQLLFDMLRSVSGNLYGFTTARFSQKVEFTDDIEARKQIRNEQNLSETKNLTSIYDSIDAIAQKIHSCTSCKLFSTRTNVVPGMGVENPDVLIIGEGPGEEEDRQGLPFVGRAGQLLDKMLNAIELDRNANCFIANIVKCRPPKNRDPEPDECTSCRTFLDSQIDALQPKMILAMGRIASHNLLNTDSSLGRLRNSFYEYKNIPVLVTYHPSALLRNEDLKRPAWEDLKLFKSRLLTLSPDYAARFHRLTGRSL
ncbi:MAG: uracil-DNA glycosylase [Treponema sp.]